MAKTLYHSALAAMGPVQVTIKSPIKKSKFPGKADYVTIQIGAEEHNYNLENPSCGAVFHNQVGRTFTIVAEGSRDTAMVQYVGEQMGAPQAPPPAAAAPPPVTQTLPPAQPLRGARPAPPQPSGSAEQEPPQGAQPSGSGYPKQRTAPQRTPEQIAVAAAEASTLATEHANRIAHLNIKAFSAALYVKEQVRKVFGQEMSETLFHFCYSNICIQMEKDGFIHNMPARRIQNGDGGAS